MNEKEVTDYLREWLETSGFFVYTGSEFRVVGERKRPDMVVTNKTTQYNTVLELKRSRDDDIFKSYKIIDYALAYCDGIEYVINNSIKRIDNFLVATELSKKGRLFANDVQYNEKRREKQADFYEKINYIEPYRECARAGDFVRSVWRMWKIHYASREGMQKVNIGILLSSENDKQKILGGTSKPKMFVMHFSRRKTRWSSWWTNL